MKRVLLYIGLLILAGCATQSDWDPPEQGKGFIVVEGIITNEPKRQHVIIHHSSGSLNADPIPVSGANVIINNEESTYELKEDTQNPGTYFTDSVMVAELNTSYSLLILYMDAIYSAKGSMVAGKTFPELIYTKNSDNELYHISYVASAFESSDPAMWEVLVDWSEVPGYENEDPETCKRRLMFYTLPTLDISQIFAPLVEQVSFPAGTLIDQRRYSLSPDHASFIRTLLLETSWQGGVFPSDPANISTNLSEGALGFFGISAVNSLSLVVTPEKNFKLK